MFIDKIEIYTERLDMRSRSDDHQVFMSGSTHITSNFSIPLTGTAKYHAYIQDINADDDPELLRLCLALQEAVEKHINHLTAG
jgi:hypothetical protein